MSKESKDQRPVPMNVANIPRSFGPNEAQSIVTYLQKRVRIENLDEAQALTTLVASFVAFMNSYFDAQAARQGPVGPPTQRPPADQQGSLGQRALPLDYEKDE